MNKSVCCFFGFNFSLLENMRGCCVMDCFIEEKGVESRSTSCATVLFGEFSSMVTANSELARYMT